MEESILTTIKKLLGLEEDYEAFDTDIILWINAAFMTLQQIGVGPEKTFLITDKASIWSDFLEDSTEYEQVKTYIYLKCRLGFDPPSSSFVLESMKEMIKETEWRLRTKAETLAEEGDDDE